MIDLVLSTIGRTDELHRFLLALEGQTFRDFRLIVVDQNPDDRLETILGRFRGKFPLVELRSATTGLNRGRNVGLEHVSAAVVGIPDDDCWYQPDALQRVGDFFDRHPLCDGLTGMTIDSAGRPSLIRWDSRAGAIDRMNVWKRGVTCTIFLRRHLIEDVGSFDERLGPGAGTPWGSGDETTYLLRALDSNFSLVYEPGIRVHHESPDPPASSEAISKGYAYGVGHGHVLRAHGYPWWFAAYRCLQLVVISTHFLATGQAGQARFYWAMARGRARGWLSQVSR